jgi:hypothetical protein
MDITFKTKKMVENGLVLDDRGHWIPLIDKLRMERFFIDHIAAGEVLRNKRWVTLDEAKTIDKSDKNQPTRETASSVAVPVGQPVLAVIDHTPEMNTQPQLVKATSLQQNNDEFSFNDFLDECGPVLEPEMEETNHSDITHEHCAMMINEGEKAVEVMEPVEAVVEPVIEVVSEKEEIIPDEQEILISSKKIDDVKEEAVLDCPKENSDTVTENTVMEQVEKAPSVDSLFVDHSEHETVVLSTSKLEDLEKVDDSLIAVTMARATRKIPTVKYNENIEEILASIEEFDEWEKKARKRQALFFAIASGVAAILGSSAIMLLLF